MRHLSTILAALILLTLSACATDEGIDREAFDDLTVTAPEATTSASAAAPLPAPAPAPKPSSEPIVVAPTPTAPTAPTAPEAPTPTPNPVFVANQQECNLLNSDDAAITASAKWNCMSVVDTLAKYEPNTKIVAYSAYDISTVIINILPNVPENYKTTFKTNLAYQSKFKAVYLVCTQDFVSSAAPEASTYGYEMVLQAKAKQYLCQQAYK